MNPLRTDIYQRIVAAKLFIDEHFQEPIDLDAVSMSACLSRFHFHRLFKTIYCRTPHAYIRAKRMEKARVLLSENKTVTEVCKEVGFESPSSFSVLFKKEIGFAPQYYRQNAAGRLRLQKDKPAMVIPGCFYSHLSTGSESESVANK